MKPRWRIVQPDVQTPAQHALVNLAGNKSNPRNVRLEASPVTFQFASAAEWEAVPGGKSATFLGMATEGGRHFGVDFDVRWFDDEGKEWTQEVTLSPQLSSF